MNRTLAAIVGSVLFGLTGTLVGCERSKVTVVMEEGANAPHPLLPTVPTLPDMPKQSFEENGLTIHTVFGAKHNIRKILNKEIDVQGYVVKVYTAYAVVDGGLPHVCANADRCSEQAPHVFIADSKSELEEAKMLMITGYGQYQQDIDDARRAKIDFDKENAKRALKNLPPLELDAGIGPPPNIPIDLDPGALVVVHGSIRRESSNGRMAESSGLIDYKSHTVKEPSTTPTIPPPAPVTPP